MIKHKHCLLHLLAELRLNISIIVLCAYIEASMSVSARCPAVYVGNHFAYIYSAGIFFCVCLALR